MRTTRKVPITVEYVYTSYRISSTSGENVNFCFCVESFSWLVIFFVVLLEGGQENDLSRWNMSIWISKCRQMFPYLIIQMLEQSLNIFCIYLFLQLFEMPCSLFRGFPVLYTSFQLYFIFALIRLIFVGLLWISSVFIIIDEFDIL